MLTLGLDEAARGPIIGSLFIVGALFEEKDLEKLKSLGVKDSKLLTHKRRVELAKKIKTIAKKIKIIQIKPDEIDLAIDGDNSLNLNWLEAHKTAEIINELKPDRAVIDCPSPNINAYKSYLRELLKNKDTELIVEHKADVNFLECSSAGIIAKVYREEEIAKIKKLVGDHMGSGYMSDPRTKEFFEENFENHPDIFRKSWTPYKKAMNGKNQAKLNDF